MRVFRLHLLVVCSVLLCSTVSHAATRTVTNLNDTGAGSLRAAIAAAVAGDTIVFSVTGTITLTTAELLINKNLNIAGPGAHVLTVARSTASGTPTFRIFNITGGSVNISGLTISNGTHTGAADAAGSGGPGEGGGIRNEGTVRVADCVLSSNTAIGGPSNSSLPGPGRGGAIFNRGTATVVNCTLRGNIAVGTVSAFGNSRGEGGGLFNESGTATLTNCTLFGNIAQNTVAYLGGVVAEGGGISNHSRLALVNCTISSNLVRGNPNSGGCSSFAFGGGLFQPFAGSGPVAELRNTIIADNLIGGPVITVNNSVPQGYDVRGVVTSRGYNLIGAIDGSFGWIATDLTGVTGAPRNPQLGPLQNNGGPTLTMELLPGSIAIDAGTDSVLAAPFSVSTDQRGPGFPRKLGAHVDIGAYERDTAQTSSTFLVTTIDDHDDGVCGVVDCTLREATNAANTVAGANTIRFKAGVTGAIVLTGGELLLSDAVALQGPGAPIVTVDGNLASRVFRIDAPGLSVAISGLTISRGRVVGTTGGGSCQGGGLYNNANLTLSACIFSGNTVSGGNGVDGYYGAAGGPGGHGQGGGLYNSGRVSLIGCTFSTNTATGGNGGASYDDPNYPSFGTGGVGGSGQGGGLYNGGTVSLSNCTLSGNRNFGGGGGYSTSFSGNGGPGQGAGIYSAGVLTVTASTISGNIASGGTGFTGAVAAQGGGLYREGTGTHVIRNTLLAGNMVTGSISTGPDASGAFTSQGYNLIGKSDGSTGFTTGSDRTGTVANPLNPLIGPLQDNGGPTPTMALLSGSPALDAGKSFGLTTDQRGLRRPADAATLPNASGGDGSDIGAFEVQGPFLTINDVSKAEGNSGTGTLNFTVTLSPASSQTVTVKYATSNATAAAGSDYVARPLTTLTFAPGVTTQVVGITINGDTTVEPNELFSVNLAAPDGASIIDRQGLGTILNDDGPTLSIADAATVEGNSGTKNMIMAVKLSQPSTQTITVRYVTANGTAVAGSDYVAVPPTSVTFAPGETQKLISITINGDTAIEPNETLLVNLLSAVNATIFDNQGTGTITNDDGPTLTINDVSVSEGNSGTKSAVFIVRLSPANATQTVTVQYATANGSAAAGSDYVAVPPTTLTFAPGVTSRALGVIIQGDTTVEANETFLVVLSNAVNATIYDSIGVGTIANDDSTESASAMTTRSSSESDVPSEAPPPAGTTDAASATPFVIATASVSQGAVLLTFADKVPDVFTVAVNDIALPVQLESKANSVTLLLPDNALKTGDTVIVTWNGGAIKLVAG